MIRSTSHCWTYSSDDAKELNYRGTWNDHAKSLIRDIFALKYKAAHLMAFKCLCFHQLWPQISCCSRRSAASGPSGSVANVPGVIDLQFLIWLWIRCDSEWCRENQTGFDQTEIDRLEINDEEYMNWLWKGLNKKMFLFQKKTLLISHGNEWKIDDPKVRFCTHTSLS